MIVSLQVARSRLMMVGPIDRTCDGAAMYKVNSIRVSGIDGQETGGVDDIVEVWSRDLRWC